MREFLEQLRNYRFRYLDAFRALAFSPISFPVLFFSYLLFFYQFHFICLHYHCSFCIHIVNDFDLFFFSITIFSFTHILFKY